MALVNTSLNIAGVGGKRPVTNRTAGIGGKRPTTNRVASLGKPKPKPAAPKVIQPKQGGQAPQMPVPEPASESAASAASAANAWMGDPQRLAALNQIELDSSTGLADLQGAAARDEQNTGQSRELLARTLAGRRVGTVRSANKLGLARSGYQDRQQANLTAGYGRDLSNLEGAFQERVAGRASQRLGLENAAISGRQGADAEAVQRQIERDQTFGVPLPVDQVAKTAAAGAAPPFKRIKHKDSTGRPGYIHVYPDGKRIFVPGRQ